MYTIDRTVEYKGVLYRVVSVLENDFLAVVKKDDLEQGNFPLQIYVLPDELVIDGKKKLTAM